MYTKITIKKVKKPGKFDAHTLKYKVVEEHKESRGWSGSGNYVDVHEVNCHYVIMSAFGQNPIAVINNDMESLKDYLLIQTECLNIEIV